MQSRHRGCHEVLTRMWRQLETRLFLLFFRSQSPSRAMPYVASRSESGRAVRRECENAGARAGATTTWDGRTGRRTWNGYELVHQTGSFRKAIKWLDANLINRIWTTWWEKSEEYCNSTMFIIYKDRVRLKKNTMHLHPPSKIPLLKD